MIYIDYNGPLRKGVFNSRMTLWRAIRDRGFPEGIDHAKSASLG
jgi:hypothetical protein